MPGETPSQTVGPYLSLGLPWDAGRRSLSQTGFGSGVTCSTARETLSRTR